VAVTGGNGFIGSRLVKALVREGFRTKSLDVIAPRDDAPLEQAQHAHVSVLDLPMLTTALAGVDTVVHLAGPVVGTVRKKPHESMQLQLAGMLNVGEAAREAGVKRLVIASSFYVYNGLPAEMVVNELTPLNVHEMEPFGAAKLMSERIAQQFADAYGMEWTALRFGSVYGAGERASNVVADILNAGARSEPFSIWGKGLRRNQYTHVDDIVAGVIKAIDAPSGAGAVNLICDEVTTTGQLGWLMKELFGIDVLFDEDRPDPPSTPYMASYKAQEIFGWMARPLAVGLRETHKEFFGADGG
jgi:nucleoside-diphosphate-sugar epimerase